MPTRNAIVTVSTSPTKILERNKERSSYTILNQHATVTIFVSSGPSHGSLVSTAGNHEGDQIGPNGGQLTDNDDLDEVWAIATAVNGRVKVTEKTRTGRLTRTGKN